MEGGPRLMTLQPAQWRRRCDKQTEPVLIPSNDDMGGFLLVEVENFQFSFAARSQISPL